MAWTTMHFAVGMGCTGAAATVGCLIFRRGWRWIPASMTLGGLWALVPDMPRIFREDFPGLPWAATLGSKSFERSLHRAGDIFFFHKQLDIQPQEFALLGLTLILLFYNLALGLLMYLEHRQRHSAVHRAFRAHGERLLVRPTIPHDALDASVHMEPLDDMTPPLPRISAPAPEPEDGVIARIGGHQRTGSDA